MSSIKEGYFYLLPDVLINIIIGHLNYYNKRKMMMINKYFHERINKLEEPIAYSYESSIFRKKTIFALGKIGYMIGVEKRCDNRHFLCFANNPVPEIFFRDHGGYRSMKDWVHFNRETKLIPPEKRIKGDEKEAFSYCNNYYKHHN